MVVVAQLRDIGDVPTTITKVCVWQGRQRPATDALRTYRDASVPAGTVIYRQIFQRIRHPVATPNQDGNATTFLSTVYSFAREGASTSQTWKAEATARITRSEGQLSLVVEVEDIRRVGEQRC